MGKSGNLKDFIILVPLVLIPIFGSFALGFILSVAIFLSFYFIIKKSHNDTPKSFKTIGVIFISYFTYFIVQGFFYSSSFSQHIHDIGKIFPILVIGILALLLKTNTFNINYKMLSLVAVSSIYLTTVLAFIFRYFPFDILILDQTLSSKTAVFGRLEMGTGNALPFATIFITFIFLTFLGYDMKSILEKIISFSASILGIFVLIFWNGSRGPLLLIAPLILLTGWYLYKNSKSEQSWLPLILGAISITLLVVPLILLQSFGIEVAGFSSTSTRMISGIKELTYSGSYDNSVSTRLTLYLAGSKAFFVNPIFGFGIGNLLDSVTQFLPTNVHFGYSHLHNMFLNHMIAGGFFGLLFLVILVTSPLLILWQSRDVISINGIYLSFLLVITIFGSGMSNVLFFHDLLSGFFSVLILIAAIASTKQGN